MLPEGHALLVDVHWLAAGLGLIVHPYLKILHAGDFLFQLGQFGVQFPAPELNIPNPKLELDVDLCLVLINADLGVVDESLGFL